MQVFSFTSRASSASACIFFICSIKLFLNLETFSLVTIIAYFSFQTSYHLIIQTLDTFSKLFLSSLMISISFYFLAPGFEACLHLEIPQQYSSSQQC